MDTSLYARYCAWPRSQFALFLDFLSLSAKSTLRRLCSRLVPADLRDVRILVISCCWLLLIERFYTILRLCFERNDVDSGTVFSPRRILLIWQTHGLLFLAYILQCFVLYRHEQALLQVIPLCFIMLIDLVASSQFGKIILLHRLIGFTILQTNVLCAVLTCIGERKFVKKTLID